jgi:hypothetical protein
VSGTDFGDRMGRGSFPVCYLLHKLSGLVHVLLLPALFWRVSVHPGLVLQVLLLPPWVLVVWNPVFWPLLLFISVFRGLENDSVHPAFHIATLLARTAHLSVRLADDIMAPHDWGNP